MALTTILRDNRERKPYDFETFPVEVENVTLRTGDYSIADFCGRDEKNDTYIPRFAVERKTGSDFLGSITTDRERFKEEIKRASEWAAPLEVVIEEPWTTYMHNLGFMGQRSVTPSQVEGTVREWQKYYNVKFQFLGDRTNGQNHAYEVLMGWLRGIITDD